MADGIPCKNCGYEEGSHVGGEWNKRYDELEEKQGHEAAVRQFAEDHPLLHACPGYEPEDEPDHDEIDLGLCLRD